MNNNATLWPAVWQPTYAFMSDGLLCFFVSHILSQFEHSCCTVLMWTHANSHQHDSPRVYAGSRSGHAMQFYSWQQFRPVGPPMVEPKWVQWDPDVTVAALAYSDSLVLYRARPTFKAMASLSIQVQPVMALLWLIARPGYNFVMGLPCAEACSHWTEHIFAAICMGLTFTVWSRIY